MSSKRIFAFVLALVACSSAEDVESTSSAVSACWDPSFGTYQCYQGDWWLEFSVNDAQVTSITVEVQPNRIVSLTNRVDLGGGYAKFTGGPSDGPVTAGTLVRLTAIAGTKSAITTWFAYRKASPLLDCSDGGTSDAQADVVDAQADVVDATIDVIDAPVDVPEAQADAIEERADAVADTQVDVVDAKAEAEAEAAAPADGGSCVAPWNPFWQSTQYSGAWWAEYQVFGGGSLAKSVTLDVVGGQSYPMSYGWGKWTSGLNYVPSGTWLVLRATDATGATAKTKQFRYLVDTPVTDPCAGTPSTSPSCVPLTRGMLSITMDDSYPSQDVLARPVMAKYGYEATIYNITRQLSTYGELPYAKSLAAAGHEVGSHTVNHYDLTTLSAKQLDDELYLSRQYLLQNVGSPVESFASPMGSYNATVLAAIRKYYTSHRTVNPGLNYQGSSVFELDSDGVYGSSTKTAVCQWIKDTAANRGWRILMFHDFTTASSSSYDLLYPIADFESILQCAQATPGLDVVTVREGAAAIRCASP